MRGAAVLLWVAVRAARYLVGHAPSVEGVCSHGRDREGRHEADAAQGFSAEAQRVNCLQVLKSLELGCRVAVAQDGQVRFLQGK